jgi:hypothetical protein
VQPQNRQGVLDAGLIVVLCVTLPFAADYHTETRWATSQNILPKHANLVTRNDANVDDPERLIAMALDTLSKGGWSVQELAGLKLNQCPAPNLHNLLEKDFGPPRRE